MSDTFQWCLDKNRLAIYNKQAFCIDEDGDKYWYLNGKCHRKAGPAAEYASGGKWWFLNGDRHREDGPAVEYTNGNKYWFLNGEYHREDGPAVEYADGYVEYYIEGIELSEQEFLTRTQAQAPTCENKIVTIDGVDYKLVKA